MTIETSADRILSCLRLTDPEQKTACTTALFRDWQTGTFMPPDAMEHVETVDTPGRPELPRLVHHTEVGRHSINTRMGHAALIHALTHIEFNAINLALDAAYRFRGLPHQFYGDWLRVAAEEAHHFGLLCDHLRALGFDYGDFPAHDGLWQMCRRTAHDALARMALVPRLLEARGLDAGPAIVRKLKNIQDIRGVEILEIILRDEICHVRIGNRWYEHLCAERELDPSAEFQRLIKTFNAPRPKPPLHTQARRLAGFSEAELSYLSSDH